MTEVMGSIPIRGQIFLTIPKRKPIMPMLPFLCDGSHSDDFVLFISGHDYLEIIFLSK